MILTVTKLYILLGFNGLLPTPEEHEEAQPKFHFWSIRTSGSGFGPTQVAPQNRRGEKSTTISPEISVKRVTRLLSDPISDSTEYKAGKKGKCHLSLSLFSSLFLFLQRLSLHFSGVLISWVSIYLKSAGINLDSQIPTLIRPIPTLISTNSLEVCPNSIKSVKKRCDFFFTLIIWGFDRFDIYPLVCCGLFPRNFM